MYEIQVHYNVCTRKSNSHPVRFVHLSASLQWWMYVPIQCSWAVSWFIEWSLATPRAVCCFVAWLVHTVTSEGWLRFELICHSTFCGEKCFVAVIVGKTWPEKCVSQTMFSVSCRATCHICVIATWVLQHVDNSVSQSLNNKMAVVIRCASVWSFPELWSGVHPSHR